MSALRVFVCDDEPLAVRRLNSMLGRVEDVEVVGSTSDPRKALELIEEGRPDLLLLDIEMAEVDGFDIVENVQHTSLEDQPLIAFVTAFRRFAPQAFETGAIDYLPKPVRLSRLETVIDRARERVAGREARRLLAERASQDALREDAEGQHLWVSRRGGEMVRVELDDVERLIAEGAYVRLQLEVGSFLHRLPLSSFEERLDPARFVRVHRSHIVRIDQVASIKRTIHGGGEVILRGGERIPIGRKYSRSARTRLLPSVRPPRRKSDHLD